MSTQRYEPTSESIDFTPLKLLYISTSKYEGDWHSTLHAHQCAEIFYVVVGQGEFHVEETVFPVEADNLVIINSNVQHTEIAVAQSPMEYIVMGVEGSDFLLAGDVDERYCTIDCANTNTEILCYMRQILSEFEGKAEHYTALAHSLLEILSIKLLRHKSVTMTRVPRTKSSLECANVKRFIDNHYKEDITLDTLAKMTYLNKYYLIHIFSKEYGVSPINYLARRRVEESRYFLAQTNYSISEIALMLGFSSASYFTQSFSRMEGISPKEFRRRTKQEKEKACELAENSMIKMLQA